MDAFLGAWALGPCRSLRGAAVAPALEERDERGPQLLSDQVWRL